MGILTPHVDLCTGFLQSTRKTNGLDALAERLRKPGKLQVGRPLAWDEDPKGMAHWVYRNINKNTPYFIVCYSYGVNTALTMCEELGKWHRSVDHLFIIDGVKRFPFVKSLSLLPWLKLAIPGNVDKATAWWQKTKRPYGHQVVSPSGRPLAMRLVDAPHVNMEDGRGIHTTIQIKIHTDIITRQLRR